jgi:hypothetical protein
MKGSNKYWDKGSIKTVDERKKKQRQENTKRFTGSLISTLNSHANV